MKYILGVLVMLLASTAGFAQAVNDIDRVAYYQAIQQDKKDLVNKELKQLKTVSPKFRDAFEGALIMKKAGLGGNPLQKLNLFKEGHTKLEAAIKKEPNNAEFRFLRLMIQENAPGILGYKDNLDADSEYVRKSYKTLPEEAQKAIVDYSKKSKVLKLQVS
jgi:uncharacterized protein YxeA